MSTSPSVKKLSTVGCTGYSSTKPASAGKEFQSSGQRDAAQWDRAGSILQTVCVPECQRQPWVSCTPRAPGTWKMGIVRVTVWGHMAMSLLLPCALTWSLTPAALCPPPHPLLHQAETKLCHMFCVQFCVHPARPASHSPASTTLSLVTAEQEVNRCHLWEKINTSETQHPWQNGPALSWTDSQGGRAAREPQHRWFPLKSQKNTVCYSLQKPHSVNLLGTPALLWEFYSICWTPALFVPESPAGTGPRISLKKN